MRRDRKTRIITIIIIIVIILAMVVPFAAEMVSGAAEDQASSSGSVRTFPAIETDRAICAQGVYLDNIPVGGMTREELEAALAEREEEMKDDVIVLYAGEQSTQVRAGDLGLACANPEVVDEALLVGKGNVFRRFRAARYVEEHGAITLPLRWKVDQTEVNVALNQAQKVLNADPVAVSMVVNEDGSLTATPKIDGVQVKLRDSVTRVAEYIENEWNGGRGGVTMESRTLPAQGDPADLVEVKDQLGTASTNFDPGNAGRAANIKRAASIISGTIIYPGEEFDFCDIVGETSEENGFELAGSYENGEVVDTYGGGICQVSSTLYNAVMRAELEVLERYPHSMTVNYLKPSLDAAIAYGFKNFRFKNSTDAPIFIYGTADAASVTFTIYGKETRPANRRVEFESRVIGQIDYTTEFTYDTNLAFGMIQSSGGRAGLEAAAYKLIYEDEVKTGEEEVNTSTYDMAPLIYTVGTKGATQAQIELVDAAIATGNISQVWAAVGA